MVGIFTYSQFPQRGYMNSYINKHELLLDLTSGIVATNYHDCYLKFLQEWGTNRNWKVDLESRRGKDELQ